MKLSKKGQAAFDTIAKIFVALAVITIVSVVMFLMMSESVQHIGDTESLDTDGDGTTNTTECQQSLACNSTMTAQNAGDDAVGWVPLIVIVMIGVMLIGLVKMIKR